ncbi:MAG: hypothetical protein CBB72_016270 [Muricauda sp. TMED12]|nr:MAG: hypothetical protein CBB72_016270 [Muricauda sp. TMED12]
MTDKVKAAEAAPEAQAEAPQLGLGDLNAMVQIIDICSKRGAFEGSELESVGMVRGRIATFVQANTPKEAKEEAPATEAEAPAEE